MPAAGEEIESGILESDWQRSGGNPTANSSLDNLTAGTTVRLGHEWLLAPLMQWHNFHMIRHVWPTTPSYRHASVWKLLEPELRARDLNIQHGFKLKPTFHPAGTTNAAS